MWKVFCPALVCALVCLGLSACVAERGSFDKETGDDYARRTDISPQRVAARVDGVPIGVDEVSTLMEMSDGGLTAEGALDALVDQQLLASEARRRGFSGGSELRVERQRALARAMLGYMDRSVTSADVPKEKLEAFYERNRARFVHDILRRVIHVVAKTGDKGFSTDEARTMAEEFSREASGVEDGDQFTELGKAFGKKYGKNFKLENLPPFPEKGSSFAPKFVEVAFALSTPGEMSDPFETSFGWHVVLLLDEMSAQNKAYEDALPVMQRLLLPKVKTQHTDEALDQLATERGVKIMEWPRGEVPSGE